MTSPRLTSPPSPRSRLLAPLLYVVALLLLVEQWLWEVGNGLAAQLATWPPLRALENGMRRLPPWAALLAFVVPGLMLLPIKFLALLAIAHGHPLVGVAVFVVAKVGGAVVVARIYVLTLPSLLALAWFARWHNRFIMFKDQLIARLRASPAYQQARRTMSTLRRTLRRLRTHLRPSVPFGSRHATRSARALRRFVSLWRRRRKPGNEQP
jgi:hypothetical protein